MLIHYHGVRAILCLTISSLLLISTLYSPAYGAQKEYERKIVEYTVPDVTLVNQDGENVNLNEIINSGKPVLLDFIYGTCTTICPVLSIGFSYFQKQLGPETGDVHLISISSDPDNDTPLVMKEYLDRYNAQPGWQFLTGKREDIFRVMKAFDSFVTNKRTIPHLPSCTPLKIKARGDASTNCCPLLIS